MKRLWEAETKLRVMTADLTKIEEEELSTLSSSVEERTLIRYFGCSDSEEMMAAWVQKTLLNEGALFQHDDFRMVSISSPLFSLMKGLMRCMQVNQDAHMYSGCHCICRQYFCPVGCGCSPVQGKKVARNNLYWKEGMTLCYKCATCLRCGKLFGCTQVAGAGVE